MSGSVLHEILSSRIVSDEAGTTYELHSEIDPREGELLTSLISEFKFSRTLEIGCAFGISSLYISEALTGQSSPHHTIIDPFQMTDWHGVGVANLKRAGFHCFELIEKPSEVALPTLLLQGKSFQFALIDGWHTFDHALVDFFYVNQLLEDGGVVVIDDVQMPGLKKLAHYVLNYPNYRLLATTEHVRSSYSARRRVMDASLRILARTLPSDYSAEVFDSYWLRPERSSALNSSMIALQKRGPDKRGWNWYMQF